LCHPSFQIQRKLYLSQKGLVINGEKAGDNSGVSVSSAGDVNGDGLSDLIVGAYGADVTSIDANEGKSYVVRARGYT
jgi:hypothetical protein